MNTPRFTGTKGTDNTERRVKRGYYAPAYAATITVTPHPANAHLLVVLALTGALTLNIGVGTSTTPPMVGDTMKVYATSDGTTRTITWGTGIAAAAATLAVTTAKYAVISLEFNGTVWVVVDAVVTA